MPGIRNWHACKCYWAYDGGMFKHIGALLKGIVDWCLIKTHRKDQ